MKFLDMSGKPCPMPFIEARKLLLEPKTTELCIRVDNSTAVFNLTRLADSIKAELQIDETGECDFNVIIRKTGQSDLSAIIFEQETNTGMYTGSANIGSDAGADIDTDMVPDNDLKSIKEKTAVIISSRQYGSGPEDLGLKLMKGFIYALAHQSLLPAHIIFLNSGALLLAEDSNTIEILRLLEQKGTTIYICGVCADYFGIREQITVGTITDMQRIVEVMMLSDNVINI